MNHVCRCAIILILGASMTFAADTKQADSDLTLMKWTIEGVKREALVHIPTSTPTKTFPLVFVFHGRSNTMNSIIKYFAFHDRWPEAAVVYMQGLPVSRPHDAPNKTNATGWQLDAADENGRDLAFFDAVLATLLKEYSIDNKRIYATGHSAGGAFTYLLWQTRGDTFAAVAPAAAGLFAGLANSNPTSLLTPKPVLHIAGKNDHIVAFQLQQTMIDIVKKVNGCDEKPVAWGNELCTEYPSTKGTPVVTYIHPGGHEMPKDAVPLIIKFFKEHQKQGPG